MIKVCGVFRKKGTEVELSLEEIEKGMMPEFSLVAWVEVSGDLGALLFTGTSDLPCVIPVDSKTRYRGDLAWFIVDNLDAILGIERPEEPEEVEE